MDKREQLSGEISPKETSTISANIQIAKAIESTALKPGLTSAQVDELCAEARAKNFRGVCIPPFFVTQASQLLEKTELKVITVVGFPLGYSCSPAKAEESKRAFAQGADEVDVVANITALKNGEWQQVRNDLSTLIPMTHMQGRKIKVIAETGMLEPDELARFCELANELEPDFVKTSTGFYPVGAQVEDVRRLRELLAPSIKIKASGGIRDRDFALELIEAGADCIGTSSGLRLLG